MTVLGFILAVVIGLSLGLLGGGGSILTIPVLVYVLRYSMKQAVPMSLVVVGVTSLFGVISHHRARNIRWDAALVFGLAAVLGAVLGARLGLMVSSRLQLVICAVRLRAAAVSMYFGPAIWMGGGDGKVGGREVERRNRKPLALVLLVGASVGLITGSVGIGGGFLYVPALVLLGGVEMKQAIGTSLVLIVISCLSGFLAYMLQRVPLPWQATLLFTAIAIVGVLVGSRLVKSVSSQGLRRGFAVFLLVMSVLVLLRPR